MTTINQMSEASVSMIEIIHFLEQAVLNHSWSEVSQHLADLAAGLGDMVDTLEGIDPQLAVRPAAAMVAALEKARQARRRNAIEDEDMFSDKSVTTHEGDSLL
jgi:hypothetical protein